MFWTELFVAEISVCVVVEFAETGGSVLKFELILGRMEENKLTELELELIKLVESDELFWEVVEEKFCELLEMKLELELEFEFEFEFCEFSFCPFLLRREIPRINKVTITATAIIVICFFGINVNFG